MSRLLLGVLALLAMSAVVAMPPAFVAAAPSTAAEPCHDHDGCDGCAPAHDHGSPGCALHCVGVLATSMPPGCDRVARADPPAEIRPLDGSELSPPFRPPIHDRSA